jgi:oligogalacturonide lyase
MVSHRNLTVLQTCLQPHGVACVSPGTLPPMKLLILPLAVLALVSSSSASNVGKVYPSEKTSYVDARTGRKITVLTTDASGSAKPYQTHPTWTADGEWIIFRSDRGGNGAQAFLVHEQTGEIIQITDGPASGTGSLNLSRKEMKLWVIRGGPQFGRPSAEGADAPPPPPPAPRQLVEINLATLLADARAGTPKDATAYERIVATLPAELRDAGGFGVDADETKAYWGVAWGTPPPRPPRAPATAANNPGQRRSIDDANTNPAEALEAARQRFAEAGKGPGGIRSIDLKTGEIKTVIDVDFRMGHVQTSHWTPGEIIYCHETTGDGPQRMWTVRGDGTGNRPLYVETPDEWITHETSSGPDEVMFNIMGHLPYLREHPTGVAVINLRTNDMKILGQVEEDMGRGRLGGFWHANGSPDGKWAASDTFKGDIFLISRSTGERILLTTDHKMRPDHAHPIFSADSKRVLIQSGHRSDGKYLELMTVEVPEGK